PVPLGGSSEPSRGASSHANIRSYRCSRRSHQSRIRVATDRRLEQELVLGDIANALRVGERAELLQALMLDLADALTRDVERATHLVEGPGLLAVEPVAKLEHAPLALGERAEDRSQRLALERGLGQLVRKWCRPGG